MNRERTIGLLAGYKNLLYFIKDHPDPMTSLDEVVQFLELSVEMHEDNLEIDKLFKDS